MNEEYLTVEQLAQRLGWEPKTVRNKMGTIFKRGIHYDSPPGLPPLFRWTAILAHYTWQADDTEHAAKPRDTGIPMARGYEMK